MRDGVIDRIYATAVLPDLWPAALDELAAAGDGRGVLLFVARLFQSSCEPADSNTEIK